MIHKDDTSSESIKEIHPQNEKDPRTRDRSGPRAWHRVLRSGQDGRQQENRKEVQEEEEERRQEDRRQENVVSRGRVLRANTGEPWPRSLLPKSARFHPPPSSSSCNPQLCSSNL